MYLLSHDVALGDRLLVPFANRSDAWILTLKVPITTAADDIHCFSEKIRLDVSSESSARQRIHRQNQALFSSKDKSKKLKCRLLQFLFGALRVKVNGYTSSCYIIPHQRQRNTIFSMFYHPSIHPSICLSNMSVKNNNHNQ